MQISRSRARPAMGTLLHIAASGPDPDAVERAIDAAHQAVELVERLMSFHDENSDLSRLNREASHMPQRVHPWTHEVLLRAVRFAEISDGLFDISVAPLLVQAGLLPRSVAATLDCGRWRDIQLLPDCRVAFARPLLLDLGGIAKGYAVDQAIHALRRGGCSEAIVNAGGDLRRFGTRPHVVHLRLPEGVMPMAELIRGAIATSAPRTTGVDRLAQPIGCIIDPKRRQPWDRGTRVVVAAPSCVVADAFTKIAALAGPACRPLLSRFGAQALWI